MCGATENLTTIQIKEKRRNEVHMDDYLMKKIGVTKDLKEEWNWIRYMVGGKLFVAICLDGDNPPGARIVACKTIKCLLEKK